MTRYVISPDVAIRLAQEEAVIRGEHQILAPTLLRSQLLSLLCQAVHRGEMISGARSTGVDFSATPVTPYTSSSARCARCQSGH